MAITWTPTITPLNIASKEATISAARLDSEDASNPKTYTVPLAKMATANEKLAVANELWAAFQAEVSQAATVAAFIDQMEIDLKANLEGREI